MDSLQGDAPCVEARGVLSRFRAGWYQCLTARRAKTRPARPRPPARIEEPPPRPTPQRGQSPEEGHRQGRQQQSRQVKRQAKGRGFSEIEDREGWHGRPLPAEMAERAIVELGGERHLTVRGPRPDGGTPRAWPSGEVVLPRYELGATVATRKAFGQALAAVGARGDVVALDGEVGNSTHAEVFAKAHPERYFEMFIAEQQLVAAAVGLQVRGYVPFA